jgi:hypothetical protein
MSQTLPIRMSDSHVRRVELVVGHIPEDCMSKKAAQCPSPSSKADSSVADRCRCMRWMMDEPDSLGQRVVADFGFSLAKKLVCFPVLLLTFSRTVQRLTSGATRSKRSECKERKGRKKWKGKERSSSASAPAQRRRLLSRKEGNVP